MRKQFLLLMLLTLLPLAGWADGTKPVNLKVAPTLYGPLTYTGKDQPLINVDNVEVDESYAGGIAGIRYAVTTTSSKPSGDGSEDVPKGKVVGSYYVWYKLLKDTDNGGSYDTDGDWQKIGTFVSIGKATITNIADWSDFTAPVAVSNLIYTGSAQELISAADIATSSVDFDGASVEYKVGDGAYANTIPTGTNATEYTVTYKIKDAKNFYDFEGTVPVSIAKASVANGGITMTNYLIGDETLTYTGDAQILIKKVPTLKLNGTVKDAASEAIKMRYIISGSTWAGDYNNPLLKRTDAGKYTIRYKMTGANVDNTEFEPITVTIKKKELTITPQTQNITYGDAAKVAKDFYTATGFVASEDAETQASILAQALTVSEIPVNAGNHTITLTPTDDAKNYKATVDANATYKINKKTLYITPKSYEKVYDGLALSATNDADKFYKTEGWIENETDENKLAVGIKVSGIDNAIDVKEGDYPVTLSATPTSASNYTPYISEGVGVLTITPKALDADWFAAYQKADQPFTNANQEETAFSDVEDATLDASIEDKSLALNTDFEVAYQDNEGTEVEHFNAVGSYKYVITGKGNYTTTTPIEKTFSIVAAENTINGEITLADRDFNSAFVAPTGLTAEFGEVVYKWDTEEAGSYTTAFDAENAPTAAGTYYVKGYVPAGAGWIEKYSDAKEFTINAIALPANFGSAYALTTEFDNAEHKPTIADAIDGLTKGTDFEVSFSAESFKNQGTYTVTFTGKGNYAKVVDEAVNKVVQIITINKKALTDAMVVADLTKKTYNGNNQNPGLTLKDADAAIADADYTITVTKGGEEIANDAEWTAAGVYNYTIEATEAGNYSGSITGKSFEIEAADVTLSKDPVALTLAYTGKEQTLVEVPEVTGGTIQFAIADEAPATDSEAWGEAPKGTNVKNYGKVWYQVVAADANYTGIEPTALDNAAITPIQLVYTLANKTVTYNKDEVATTDNMYKLTSGTLVNGETIDQVATISFTDGEKKNAGTYAVNDLKVEFLNDVENYDISFTGNATLTIEKYNITAEDLDVAPTLATGLKFKKATAQSLLAEPAAELAENIGSIVYATAENGEYAATVEATDPAKYAVWYKIVAADQANYNDMAAVKIGDVEIIKGGFASIEGLPEENGVYTGAPQSITFTVKDENDDVLTAGTDYNVFIFKGETSVSAAQNAGDYTYKFIGAGNYEGAEDELTWTIDKADITITAEPAAVTGLTYNGLDQVLVNAGTASFGKVLYSTDGETYAEALPTGKDVAEYNVTYKVEGDDNHNAFAAVDLAEAIAIAPAELTVTAPTATKVYNAVAGFDGTETIASALKIEGLQNNEEIAAPANAFTVKDEAADVAVYFTEVNEEAFAAFKNYTVTKTNKGTLEIQKAPAFTVTFAANKQFEKNYGADDDFALAATDIQVENFLDDDDAILAAIEAVRAIEGENVGTIENAVKLQAVEGAAFNNYEGFTVSGTADLVISKDADAAAIEISIAAQSKDYDGQPAVATLSLDKIVLTGDLLNGDTKESLLGANAENLTVTVNGGEDAVDAGSYELAVSGTFNNYNVTFVPSTYTINTIALTASVEDQTVASGALVSNIDNTKYTVTGFIEGEENLENNFQVVVADAYQADGKITADADHNDGLKLIAKDESLLKNYTGWENVTGTLTITNAAALELSRAATDLPAVLEAANGATSKVTFATSRALNAEKWNGFVLPFDVKPMDLIKATGKYVVVNVLDLENTDANKIKFALKMSGTIAANTPFLLKTDEASNQNEWVFEGVEISYPGVAPVQKDEVGNTYVEDAAGNKFFGVYTKVEGLDSKNFLFSQGTYYQGPIKSVSPLANYLEQSPKATQAPVIYVEEMDGSTTAIDAVSINGAADNDGWYNVNGMKRNNAPAQKGVYIKNGKKVIVK